MPDFTCPSTTLASYGMMRKITVYIIDYTFMTFTDPNDKWSRVINRDSLDVVAFGIWRQPVVKGRNRPDPPPPEDEVYFISRDVVPVQGASFRTMGKSFG